ncbi:unnamed protein product [Staurois parvus]|uniref:Uncharacterized protein n=1 Tax=Staurois parvus TaxID=386267 RepID=A0ABN9G796_9NEOB|nr:unnamed protein product [Staurois parvus]
MGQTLDRLTGQQGIGSPGIRSFGSTAGNALIWQGSGLRVNRHDSGHRVIRYRIVWLDSRASGHQASGHLACQRAPRSSGKAVGTGSPGIGSSGSTAGIGSPGTTAGSESIGTDSGHRIRYGSFGSTAGASSQLA